MQYQFLTLTSCFQGILLNGVESVFSLSLSEPSIPEGYQLIQWIKRQGGDNCASVGIFEDKSGARVIIKHLQYRWKNLTYRQEVNEISLLELFAGWSYTTRSGRTVSFPVLREVRNLPGELIVVKEFEVGESLDTESPEHQRNVLADCFEAFHSLTARQKLEIGKRAAWQIGLSFPFYWLRAFLKNPRNLRLMMHLFSVFYQHWSSTIDREYVVTHRDLHPRHMLTRGSMVLILDLESMVLCTKETELALVTLFNHRDWGYTGVRQLLSTDTDAREAERSFSALSIYYGVQMMLAKRAEGPSYYQETVEYLKQYKDHLASLTF